MTASTAVTIASSSRVFIVRGATVMLDADVASAFGITTGQVNQAVFRNPSKFLDEHCFTLSAPEADSLKSQSVIANPGRGGRRTLPRVFSAKGVARLATILTSDEALRATDLIIDTFLSVQSQIAAGRQLVEIEAHQRYLPDADPAAGAAFRSKLQKALTKLLDTIVDVENQSSVRGVLQDTTTGALANLRERLRAKGLENAKLEAETELILAQGEQVMASVRKTDAETDGIRLDNLERQMKLVRTIAETHREMTSPALVQLLGALTDKSQKRALEPPIQRTSDHE